MNILHTLEVYQRQYNAGLPSAGLPLVLSQFRALHESFSEEDIVMLAQMLEDETTRRFAIHLSGSLEQLPECLLHTLLNAAIKEQDTGLQYVLIKTCRRVFGFIRVHTLLMEWLERDDGVSKAGVVNVLLRLKPDVFVTTVFTEGNRREENTETVFVWNTEMNWYEEVRRPGDVDFCRKYALQKAEAERGKQELSELEKTTTDAGLKKLILQQLQQPLMREFAETEAAADCGNKSRLLLRTRGVKTRQMLLLAVSGLFLLASFLVCLFMFSFTALAVFILLTAGILLLNYYSWNHYDLTVYQHGLILAENIWGVKRRSTQNITRIGRWPFFLSLMNPFIQLKLESGEKLVMKMNSPTKVYLSDGGIRKYIEHLKDTLQ